MRGQERERACDGFQLGRGILLIAPMALFIVLTVSYGGHGETWIVDDDGGPWADHNNIQDAIDAATGGDSILVYSGEYDRITINKSLSLIGNGSATTSICGNYSGHVVTIFAHLTNFTGFTVKESGDWDYGISVGSDDVRIYNNSFLDNHLGGIELQSERANIHNNTFTDDGIRIFVLRTENEWASHSIESSNTVAGKPLVYLANSRDKVVSAAGQVILANCTNITIQDLEISNWTGCELISTAYSDNITVINNHLSGRQGWDQGTGIALFFTEDSNVTSNNISIFGNGIYLRESSENNVSGNNVSLCDDAIRLREAMNNIVFDNVCEKSRFGIHLFQDCDYNVLRSNTCSNNTEFGIRITQSDHNRIETNIIFNNSENGIRTSGDNITLIGNRFVKNGLTYWDYKYDLFLYGKDYVINECEFRSSKVAIFLSVNGSEIFNNSFIDIEWYSIVVDDSTKRSRIHHNNFWSSGYDISQCMDNSTGTIWEKNYEGNYWSDYNGTDSNSDGIGDRPYHILGSPGVVDRYPLMEPNGSRERPTTWIVDDDNGSWADFDTIQDAINASDPGNTIRVFDGNYSEKLIINSEVTVRGNSTSTTFIEGIRYEPVINISADATTISGFHVSGGSIGIKIGSDENVIRGNIIVDNDYGIEIVYRDNNSIIDNEISTNDINGISIIQDGTGSLVRNNSIHNNGWGLNLFKIRNVTVDNNSVGNNVIGLRLGESRSAQILNNTFINDSILIDSYYQDEEWTSHEIADNSVNSKPIYYFKNASGFDIPSDFGQLILANVTDVAIDSFDVSNIERPVMVGYSRNITISNNRFVDSHFPVTFDHVQSSTITYNTFIREGVDFERGSNGNVISYNRFVSVPGGCLHLLISDDNSIFNNSFIGDKAASKDAGYVGYGIYLLSADGNRIFNNTILNNRYGLYLRSSISNHFHHNNIVNNSINVNCTNGCSNKWNSSHEGNYWSDYTGTDVNGDGIGDIPNNIDGDENDDHFPLMEPNGSRSVPTWIVDDDNGSWADFENIQGAIDHASEGDVIRVYNGTYSRSLNVSKRLSIVGNGSGESGTLFDSKEDQRYIDVNADGVLISKISFTGFRKETGWIGQINVEKRKDVRIENCSFDDTSNTGQFIVLEGGKRNEISNCQFYNGGSINIRDESNKNILAECYFYKSRLKISGECENNTVLGCEFESTSIYVFHGCAGLHFVDCEMKTTGIELDVTWDVIIENCTIKGASKAITTIPGISRITVKNCTIRNISDCGISISEGLFCTFTGNVFSRCKYGISIWGGSLGGAKNHYGSWNTIAFNTFDNMTQYAIWLRGSSSNNSIHHNVFTNNGGDAQVRDDCGDNNTWDDGIEGNYWDDYEGSDSNNDGIGDTPYNISGEGNAVDRYPLMEPGGPGKAKPTVTVSTDVTYEGYLVEGETITVVINMGSHSGLPHESNITVRLKVLLDNATISGFTQNITVQPGSSDFNWSRNLTLNESGFVTFDLDVLLEGEEIETVRKVIYGGSPDYTFSMTMDRLTSSAEPGGVVRYTLNVENKGNLPQWFRISCDQNWISITNTSMYILPDSVNTSNVTAKIPASANGSVTFTITGEVIGEDDEVLNEGDAVVTITLEGEKDDPEHIAWVFVGASVGIIAGAFAGLWTFERSRYLALPFLLFPLYSKIKREAIVDHATRGRIVLYLNENPGAHFNRIKKELDLKNGTTGYHLRVLESGGFIKSRADGMYRRFYPYGYKVPDVVLSDVEKRVVMQMIKQPGIKQRELASRLDISQSTVAYHIKDLKAKGVVSSERRWGCHITDEYKDVLRTGKKAKKPRRKGPA